MFARENTSPGADLDKVERILLIKSLVWSSEDTEDNDVRDPRLSELLKRIVDTMDCSSSLSL